MKINHIAMYVKDLEQAKKFFIKYFNAKSNNLYQNNKTQFKSYFLSFDDNTKLEIMTRPELIDQPKEIYRTGFAHLALSVGSKSNVNELTNQLKNDGYTILSEPRTTGDGYYESCIIAIEGNIIEITE